MTVRMRVRAVVLAVSVTAAGCAPTDHRVVLNELRAELAGQYGDGRVWLPIDVSAWPRPVLNGSGHSWQPTRAASRHRRGVDG